MTLTQPYQSGDGGDWIVCDGVTKYRFDTEAEAYIWREAMDRKLELAKTIIAIIQSVINIMDNGPDVWQQFFDAPDHVFTDDELASLGITANDLIACVTMLENTKKFFAGVPEFPPVNAVYRQTVNAVR